MNRLKVVLPGVLVLLVLFFVWQGRNQSPVLGNAGGVDATKASAPEDVRRLKLGLNIAAGSALHAASLRFSALVAERSQGKLNVQVFPDQELGNDDQMLEMARNGDLDLVLIPTAKLSSAIPAMQYADLPFYFSGRDELYAMLDGEPGRLLLSKLAKIDLVGLTFWENGFKQFTANRPVRTPRDLAGLRIRVMKSPMIAQQFSSLGAKAIPIDFHATYQALKEGAVDGQENPLVAIVGMRFHEVQKHLTVSNHAYLAYVFAASKKAFQNLSPEAREILLQSAKDLTAWEREATARREAGFLEQVRAAGVEVYTLSSDERKHFSDAMAPLAEKFGFEVGYDLYAKTEELRQRQAARPAGTKNPWIIALDADLSARGAQAGGAIYRGMQMAIDEVNGKGGVLGAPVRLWALDHGALPSLGKKNLEALAANPSVVAVVGGMHSAVISEELPLIHQLKIPYVIPWAAAQSLTKHDFQPSYTFRVSLDDSSVTPFLLERALTHHKKVGILLERSIWGRSSEAAMQPVLAKLPKGGYQVVWFNNGEQMLGSTVEQLIGAGCDALVFIGNGIEAGELVEAMSKQQKPIPIFAHWALVGGDFWGANQRYLERVDLRFAQSILADEGSTLHPRLPDFLKRYRQRYGLEMHEAIPSLSGSVHAYDATHLILRALEQAGTADREVLRNTLENLRVYDGVMRRYQPAFSSRIHDALNGVPLHLGRFDSRGRIVLAE